VNAALVGHCHVPCVAVLAVVMLSSSLCVLLARASSVRLAAGGVRLPACRLPQSPVASRSRVTVAVATRRFLSNLSQSQSGVEIMRQH